jgi:hypothetical protein
MADNKTAIANIAVLSLAQNMISSLTANEPMAKKINAIFEQTVSELVANDWFFNRHIEPRQISVSSAGTPSHGRYKYGYAIPSESVFIRGLCDVSNEDVRYRFERRGRYIVTNQPSPIYLLYNEKLERSNGENDISLMPLWFHRLISARLAYILAPNVTENQRLRGKIEIEWQKAYLHAREMNGEDAYVEGEQGNEDWRDGARDIAFYSRSSL